MAAAIGAYLLFAIAYTAMFGEPHQKDIAKSFGAVPVQVLLIVDRRPDQRGGLLPRHALRRPARALPRIAAALISGLIFGGLHATDRRQRRAAADRLRLHPRPALREDRLDLPGILLHMLNNSVALLGQ